MSSGNPPGVAAKDFASTASDSSSNSTEPEGSPSSPPRPPPSAQDAPPLTLRMPPSLRASSDPQGAKPMTLSSQPLGIVNNARKPPSLTSARGGGGLPQDMQAKMKAFHLSRQGTPPGGRPAMGTSISTGQTPQSPVGGAMGGVPGLPGGLRLPGQSMRPQAHNFTSAPAVPRMGAKPSLSERRKMHLGGLPGGPSGGLSASNGESAPTNSETQNGGDSKSGSMFAQFSKIVDTKAGTLNFAGKAVIHGGGIDFSSGSSFNISLDEVDTMEELGKGNYGTVYKVRHARPKMRRPGLGLGGNKPSSSQPAPLTPTDEKDPSSSDSPTGPIANKTGPTGVVMAMKEIRLELDEAKFAAIIMELDVLHRCLSPYIVDFYGAFFQEGAVYICLEFMDGGSIDKLYGDGIPESILRKITYATTVGLRTLKDKHNIIHRDVKPTNILVNTKGQVKICDFGVSGNLVASIAKTNIGCQSYMAPERISGGGVAQAGANPGGGTYSVQSDIWSLGLTIIECAMGRYPYPPETYNNIFSQLSAIVDGEPPDLPKEGYSPLARDFVRGCLNKIPKLRPTYAMLLQHGWLSPLAKPSTISEDDEEGEGEGVTSLTDETSIGTEDREVAKWVQEAIKKKKEGRMGSSAKPALHAAPLDSVSPATSPAPGNIAAANGTPAKGVDGHEWNR